jgi:EAL domain-containing protein (putative c-di-GMP-specific phosphodiesterase class I)
LVAMGLPGDCVSVEITEGLLLDSDDVVTTKLLEWRDAGIQVALDDFGTGYSSLSYLQKFDIDFIKIDQSFVRDLQPQSTNFALCKAMVAMAHALGLQVVAEGVETAAQRDLLLETGCDFAQGYFYARPMAPEGLHAWVADRNPGLKR